MRLKTLTYTSRARLETSDGDLNDIYQAARNLNAIDGVTGLLIFEGVRFVQIIEGADEAIDNLVERLRRDRRHTDLRIRDERFVEERSFSEWSMNLLRLTSEYGEARAGLSAILPSDTSPEVRALLFRITDQMAG